MIIEYDMQSMTFTIVFKVCEFLLVRLLYFISIHAKSIPAFVPLVCIDFCELIELYGGNHNLQP